LQKKGRRLETLTEKQCEYVAQLAEGKSTKEIALQNSVSHHTIRNTLRNARLRIGCPNSISLVATAISEKMILKTESGYRSNF
jgi:DNA-binding CsgD family transcriptional regulator